MTTQYKNHSRKRTPWDCNTRLSPMETFIKSKYLDSYDYKHPFIKETMEADLLNSYEVTCCKRCASTDFKKKGFTKNGIQRYYCNICKRYFNVLTGTMFDNHKIAISEWIEFCLGIFRYESINLTSKNNKNSFTTSKYWLYKLFYIIEDMQDDIVLEGNVYIDETFYPVVESDKTVKDGKKLRGLSKDQICIGIAYDGNHVYAHVEGFGKTYQKKTKDTFINHIKPGSHLIHDKEKSHKILIKELKLSDESYDANKLKKCKDKDNPLNPINRQCYLLKRFLRSHPGFSRDDIQHYINLHCFISNPPADKLEKVEMVLNSAIHLTKSLRYRDFYASKSR